jgi:hypothetical protein
MARRASARGFSALEKRLLKLRTKGAALRREERAVERAIDRLVPGKRGRLTRVRHGAARARTAHPRPTGPRLSLAAARRRGNGGLFCGCRPIRILPQPNGDLDICILVGCDAEFCEYWCGTLEAEPVVAIAARKRKRPARAGRSSS